MSAHDEDPTMQYATASQQIAALRERKTSAVELLEQTLARIDAQDRALNAVVVRDQEAARQAAVDADAALARGERRPLLGLPMTVKECFNIAGLPTTWGIPGTQSIRVRGDAVVVQRLKAAGAVVLGKTNVPPNLADWQTANPIYGVTRNPWDLRRSPGGSSGGSAAALAAGYVALEMGTDIGGSLRVPAHCCGVFAHKPSYGLVPMRGCAPPGTPELDVSAEVDLAVVGPMARSAADLALALDVVAGADDDRARAWRLQLPEPRHERLQDHRVLVLRQHPQLPTGTEVADAMERWTSALARAGCRVADHATSLPDLQQIARTYGQLLLAFFGAQMPAPEYEGMRRAAQALSPTDDSEQALELRAFSSTHRDWIAADRVRASLRQAWHRLFEEWDVVVCPVMPLPAMLHDDAPMEQRRLDVDGQQLPYSRLGVWAGPATVAGLPATAMPIGLGPSKLPIGVQIVGAQYADRTTLAFARQAETLLGGFIQPPSH
jgi:amidase